MVSLLSWCFIPDKMAVILLHLPILSDLILQSSLYTSVSRCFNNWFHGSYQKDAVY